MLVSACPCSIKQTPDLSPWAGWGLELTSLSIQYIGMNWSNLTPHCLCPELGLVCCWSYSLVLNLTAFLGSWPLSCSFASFISFIITISSTGSLQEDISLLHRWTNWSPEQQSSLSKNRRSLLFSVQRLCSGIPAIGSTVPCFSVFHKLFIL